MDLEALKKELSNLYLIAICITSTERKMKIILTNHDINHPSEFYFPAFKKKVLPAQQQFSNHYFQPMGNDHNLELLLFPNKLLFKTTLPNFLLNKVK